MKTILTDEQHVWEITVFVWEFHGKIDLSIYEQQNKDTRQGIAWIKFL